MLVLLPDQIRLDLHETTGINFTIQEVTEDVWRFRIMLEGICIHEAPGATTQTTQDIIRALPPHLHASNATLQQRFAILKNMVSLLPRKDPAAEDLCRKGEATSAQVAFSLSDLSVARLYQSLTSGGT